jgi:hypothetical protein
MENDPHQLIEGILIAGRAVDSHKGYIYIRGEYRYLIEAMDRAIAERIRAATWARTSRAPASISISTRTPARAPTSAEKKPRCSIPSKANAAFRA